jgi:hypothetical protein
MASQNVPPQPSDEQSNGQAHRAQDLELLNVMVTREGKQVAAQWGIHPQMKKDLLPDEWREVNELMTKVTGIVGSRFAEILSEADPDHPGTA